MKKVLLIVGVVTLALALVGCKKDSISTEVTGKGNFELELLFEKDSCKVYRFTDMGRLIYFSDCRGNISYESGSKHKRKVQTINE